VAVVPQSGRCGWIILDLSFLVYQDVNGVVTAVQSGVNDTTTLSAPDISVKEIGKVLPRLLHYMWDTPAGGLHILFSKLDLSDGFWSLIVQEADSYYFAYILPQEVGEPCRVVSIGGGCGSGSAMEGGGGGASMVRWGGGHKNC